MSLATLKRKTATKYNNMSVGSVRGFSLAGTHRNQGYVGQTSLSRSFPLTNSRRGAYRGHGGCCSTYMNDPIKQTSVWSLEDSSVVKKSSKTFSGMFARRFPKSDFTTVKPDVNNNLNNSAMYTSYKKKKNTDCISKNPNVFKAYDANCKIGICHYTKPEEEYVAMSSGEYIEKLKESCHKINEFFVARSTQAVPFACG